MKRVAVAFAVVLLFSGALAHAAGDAAYDWRSKDYASGEAVLGCAIGVTATRTGSYVSLELAVKAASAGGRKEETELRVTAARRETGDLLRETRLPVSDAWLRSSSGSTVGVLRPAGPSPTPEYVATAPGVQPFADLFRGIRQGGAVFGVRLGAAGADQVDSAGPPPKAVSDHVVACVNRLLERR